MSTVERTLIRTDTDYALRMLACLAKQPPQGVPASSLSKQMDVPHGFAQKILRKLAGAGLLKARPGRGGGFLLARKPEELSLMDVIAAVQGPPLLNRCTGDPKACSRQPDCPVSDSLRLFQDKLNGFLRSTKLSSIIDRSRTGPAGDAKPGTTVRDGGTRTTKSKTRKTQG